MLITTNTDEEIVNAALDDLELPTDIIEDDLSEEDLVYVEKKLKREELYESQPSEIEAPKKKKVAPGGKLVKVEDVNAAIFRTITPLPTGIYSDEDYKKMVLALRPKQKKIAEKFDNLITSVALNKKPSEFICLGFNYTLKNHGASRVGLKNMFLDRYSPGTAASQAGQIYTLFVAIGLIGPRNCIEVGHPIITKLTELSNL